MQFLGSIDAKIDAKMRVFVPAAFRKILQGEGLSVLVLRKDLFQDCLILYPENVWDQEVQALRQKLSRWDRSEQQLFRQFVVDAERLEIDANGRILIPKRYLQMINVDSEVQFLGVDNTIEIWSKGALSEVLIDTIDFGTQIQKIMNKENPNE